MRYYDRTYDFDLDDPNSNRIRRICEDIITYVGNYDMTLRQAAKNIMIPKSTIHMYIHTYIRDNYEEEYYLLKRRMKYNKENRSKPQRYWR